MPTRPELACPEPVEGVADAEGDMQTKRKPLVAAIGLCRCNLPLARHGVAIAKTEARSSTR